MSVNHDLLVEKVEKELTDFKKSYENFSSQRTYNDWYVIGFHEEYSEMLCSDFLENRDYEDLFKWLSSFDKPLAFLYDQWLSSDGAFSHDWDDMIDWVQLVYQEEVRERSSTELVQDSNEAHKSLDEVITGAEAERDRQKTWVEEKREELAEKPRSEWTEEDWDSHNYCKNVSAEADYYDSLDDR